MTSLPDFPLLDSAAKCVALWPKYPQKVVGMWATGSPRQNVDVLWRLREELLKLDIPVVFFFKESARTMLSRVIAGGTSSTSSHIHSHSHSENNIYQLDDAKLFRLLNFVEVLVTNDYCVGLEESRHINAKLVGLHHHAKNPTPYGANYYYDYFASDIPTLSDFDYSGIPDSIKIHRNPHFTLLAAGHSKIDLIVEERAKNTCFPAPPVLLLYPNYLDMSMRFQNISQEAYVDIWSNIISAYLNWSKSGIVVYRPPILSRNEVLAERIANKFMDNGRFFLDTEDDNKFWISRASYFITDYSGGLVNFCLTAKRPAIQMIWKKETEEPKRDEWGWTISRPEQLIPLLEEMNKEAQYWTEALREKQEREMPTLGRNFVLLAGMIKRIFNNDDDPEWLRMDKGHTLCQNERDMLKQMPKLIRMTPNYLHYINDWVMTIRKFTGVREDPRIWLLCLRYALLADCERESFNAYFQLYKTESPDYLARFLSQWLDNVIKMLPFKQTVGLLRHLMRHYAHQTTKSLLITITSNRISGHHKKRALFFLLMEMPHADLQAIRKVNELAERMPQYFSRPVLGKINRFLPAVMKVPLALRRFTGALLGLKKPLAKKYWHAHRSLS
ncbi:MAG: hypothetical protein HDQ92_08815 [Desulfovibrio sp.]|nr:hypothetical protein [Desulfovibrio sp.]